MTFKHFDKINRKNFLQYYSNILCHLPIFKSQIIQSKMKHFDQKFY